MTATPTAPGLTALVALPNGKPAASATASAIADVRQQLDRQRWEYHVENCETAGLSSPACESWLSGWLTEKAGEDWEVLSVAPYPSPDTGRHLLLFVFRRPLPAEPDEPEPDVAGAPD